MGDRHHLLLALTLAVTTASPVFGQTPDPEYDAQWGLAAINAAKAYEAGYTGKGVNIGVVDSGLDIAHPEFDGRFSGISLDAYTNAPVVDDNAGHGTHVSGIIAANRDGVGMMGVAPDALISPFALLDAGQGTTTSLIETYVPLFTQLGLDNGVRIFSNSWGPYGLQVTDFTAESIEAFLPNALETYREAVSRDALIVFATGNFLPAGMPQPEFLAGLPYLFPELQNNWIAVTAVDQDLRISDYVNRCGVAAQWCIAAPGIDIFSTLPDGGYGLRSGTSMAAPHVAGALAIASEMFPNARAPELAQFVLQTANDLGDAGVDPVYGWGLLDIGAMIDAISPAGRAIYADAAFVRTTTISLLSDTVLDRMSRRRLGDSYATDAPPPYPVKAGTEGGAAPISRAFWAEAFFSDGSVSGEAGAPRADFNVNGGIFGADFTGTEQVAWGAAGAVTRGTASSNGMSNDATASGYHGMLYISLEQQGWFADVVAGASVFDQDYERATLPGTALSAVRLNGLRGSATSQDIGYFASARGGRTLQIGNMTLEPFAEASFIGQRIDGATEQGASVFALALQSQSLSLGEAGVGFKATTHLVSGTLRFTPQLELAYGRQFGDIDSGVTVLMLGTPFQAVTGADDPNVWRAGLELRVESAERPISGFIGYSGEFQQGAELHAAQAGLQLRF